MKDRRVVELSCQRGSVDKDLDELANTAKILISNALHGYR